MTAPERKEKDVSASATPLLDQITTPEDFRHFTDDQLKQLAEELRHDTVAAVAKTGGHLGASLGVVELTVALHAVFKTPADKLDLGCRPSGLPA